MKKSTLILLSISLLFFPLTLSYTIGWCSPTLPLPPPRDVNIEYLEAMQRVLPENYFEVIRYILDHTTDPYIRHRAVFTLTDIALNKYEADNIIDFLTKLAMDEKADDIRTSAYASIDLIRSVYRSDKRGSLDLFVSGDTKKGGTIVLIAKVTSTIATQEEAIVGITSLHNNIELLSDNAVQRMHLRANEPHEIRFDLKLTETGNYFIPVTVLISFGRIDYEQIDKKIYLEVNDEFDNCLDDQNPNKADYESDGDIDGSDLNHYASEYGTVDQECYDISWFSRFFGVTTSDNDQEGVPVNELGPSRFIPVKPLRQALICLPGCECLTGPDAEDKFGYGTFDACSDTVCGYGWVGDLYMAKYCYSQISIDECIDTDGGKNYEVKGSTPGCEDRCSEFSHPPTVLNECYANIVDGKCQVNIAYYDCDTICEDGRCLPPTCDDWIQNQGEAGIDCGGPCDEPCICPSGCKCATGIEAADKFGAGQYMTCTARACGEEWVGDFRLPKHCYKKIDSFDCMDTDGGADIYEKGYAPGCEDICTSDRMLRECVAIQTIDGCEVYSSAWECEGACQDGACIFPTCNDGIQNQDEVAVDCSIKSIYADCDSCCNNGIQDYDEEGVDCGGSQCLPCGYVQVRGRILYEDSDNTTGSFKPVRYGKFYLRLCDSHPCSSPKYQAQWFTDVMGRFNFMVEKHHSKSAFIRLGHEDDDDPYKFNYAARIAKDLDDCHETVWWHSASRGIPQSGIIDFGELRIGMNSNIDFQGYWQEETDAVTCGGGDDESGTVDGGSGYFNIADAILYARQYADGKRSDNDAIGYVDVQWPDSTETSHYSSMYEEINLEQDDGFDDGTIVHEYGHYLQDAISTSDDYWGSQDHDYCTKGKDEEFAWREGFAEYFGTIVPNNYSALSKPNVSYWKIERPYCFESTYDGCCNWAGKESEATVSAVLWDLADTLTGSLNEGFDTVSGMETLIFNIFDDELDNGDSIVADAPDLCEFIEQGINCRVSSTEKAAIWDILTHYYVICSSACDN